MNADPAIATCAAMSEIQPPEVIRVSTVQVACDGSGEIAPELGQRMTEPLKQARVLGSLFRGNEIGVGLQQHMSAPAAVMPLGGPVILP